MVKLKKVIKEQDGKTLCKAVEKTLEGLRRDYQAQKEKILKRLARLPLKTTH